MPQTQSTPYVIDIDSGEPLRFDLSLPEEPVTTHALLPSIFRIADAIHERSIATVQAMGKSIGCGPNCGACCNQLVPISEWEAAHLANVVRNMEQTQRKDVIKRFTKATMVLSDSGLLDRLTEAFTHQAHDWRIMTELKREYWELKIPCPLLENGSCSIHPHRPLVCRQYLVTSHPRHCENIYSKQSAHEVVTHPVDMGGALASFSGEGLQQSQVLPLVFSLLAERSIAAKTVPTLPGPQMMDRFLNCLATGFVNKD